MSQKIFDNIVAISKSKVTLTLNKPAYILKLSKVLMYELHYDYIKNKYDNKSKLLFTYNYSVVYEINVYEDFISNQKIFDFTDYSTKVKIIEQELSKSTKFHCLVLIRKYLSKAMDMIDQLLKIRVNYKKTVILITI